MLAWSPAATDATAAARLLARALAAAPSAPTFGASPAPLAGRTPRCTGLGLGTHRARTNTAHGPSREGTWHADSRSFLRWNGLSDDIRQLRQRTPACPVWPSTCKLWHMLDGPLSG
eukprot:14834502-Alexandrium_andersonii.AAC.1